MTRPEWVEAGAQAILGEEATSTSGYYASSHRVDMEHCHDLAREVIAAVEPLIRADERERNTSLDIEAFRVALTRNLRAQIAAEIMAQHGGVMCYRVHPIDGTPLVVCSHERDARIARGES